jgi:iron(III) transport system ATP-binding protein
MKAKKEHIDERKEQIRVEHLTKSFPGIAAPVVENLSFTLRQGEILALIGPSGCGKTTTLRLIAGFTAPDAGRVFLHGRDVTTLPPQERRIGIVFQDYALFPHMTVEENICFGMRLAPKKERPKKAVKWMRLMELEGLGKRYPHELSGGQQQRTALARTLSAEPDLVLLDEPFSNLDAALRTSTRKEMRRLFKDTGVTAILVTHDQAEALSFADRLGMMSSGKLRQIDTPERMYLQPNSRFVAEFLGHSNLLRVDLSGRTAQSPLGPITTTTEGRGPCWVSLRPEQLELVPDERAIGRIVHKEFRGRDFFCHVDYGGRELMVVAPFDCPIEPGSPVRIRVARPAVVLED